MTERSVFRMTCTCGWVGRSETAAGMRILAEAHADSGPANQRPHIISFD
jgi:hypothetical protein